MWRCGEIGNQRQCRFRFTILYVACPRGESPIMLAGQLEPGQLETQKLSFVCLDWKTETLLTGVASKTQSYKLNASFEKEYPGFGCSEP